MGERSELRPGNPFVSEVEALKSGLRCAGRPRFPNPVAVLVVVARFASNSTVVSLVPADGVKDEAAGVTAVIFVRLAGNWVVWQSRQVFWGERFECFRKLAIGEPVSFEGAGEGGLIGRGLGNRGVSGDGFQLREQQRRQKMMVDNGVEGSSQMAPIKGLFKFMRPDAIWLGKIRFLTASKAPLN